MESTNNISKIQQTTSHNSNKKHFKLKSIAIIIAFVIYIVMLFIIHTNYDYLTFEMIDEEYILLYSSLLYILLLGILAGIAKCFPIFKKFYMQKIKTTKQIVQSDIANSIKPSLSDTTNIDYNLFDDAGIVGLEVYNKLSKFVGIVCLIVGLVCLLLLANSLYVGILGVWFILCGLGCFASISFVKALISIVKALISISKNVENLNKTKE